MSTFLTRQQFVPTFNNWFDDVLSRDLFDLTDRNFSAFGTTFPSANVQESEKDFAIDLAVPGMKKEDFKIELNNNILSVSSEIKEEKEEKDTDFRRREFRYEAFSRSFQLPEAMDEKKVDAAYKDGILHISVGKRKIEAPKAVKAIAVK
jgi:HSP20 family protein